jgi:putative spermidine/putrescine transport system substrate-binding protein
MSRLHPELETKKLPRRRFIQGVGVLTGGVIGIGPARPLSAEEEFTIAVTGGAYGDAIRSNFVKASDFEKQFNVSVAYSNELMSVTAAKILANCGHPIFSVADQPQAEAVLLADGGCIAGYSQDLVPNYKDIHPSLTLTDSKIGPYYASYSMVIIGLTWNTKLAKRPTSYKDIWSASYKGKVGVPAYGWYGMYWLHAINKLFGGNEDNITPGLQAVADLVKKNDAVIIDNADHGANLFQREEILIAPFASGRTFVLQEKGVPLDFEYVTNSIALGAGFVIVNGTAFPEIAQRFVNRTLEGEYQLGIARVFKYPPTNRTIQMPPDLDRIRVPDGKLDEAAHLDWKRINNHRSEYLERWNKEVLS